MSGLIDPALIDIDTGHIESGFTERQCERQADVAQADYAESGSFGLYAVFKFEIGVGVDSKILFNDCAHVLVLPVSFAFPVIPPSHSSPGYAAYRHRNREAQPSRWADRLFVAGLMWTRLWFCIFMTNVADGHFES